MATIKEDIASTILTNETRIRKKKKTVKDIDINITSSKTSNDAVNLSELNEISKIRKGKKKEKI